MSTAWRVVLHKTQPSFSSVQISFIVHASEREASVVDKVTEMLIIPRDSLQRLQLEGYYGNPIIRYSAHLTDRQKIMPFVSNLFTKMTEGDKHLLKAELTRYVDEHEALHLRIDKQSLFDGKIVLSQQDSVKIKLKPKMRYPGTGLIQLYSEVLLR
jgi:RNA binding exosome subunit